MTCVGKPVWDHLLREHADCSPNKKKKNEQFVFTVFGFAVHLDSELSSVALFCSHIVLHVNNSPEFSHHWDFLCPFLSWSKSAGMKTMHNSQWRPGVESNASLWCIFLSLTFFPSVKKKTKTQTLYYFNKLLVLIHYWSSGWSTGHCITRILKPIMAWHSCACEKLYQLWNQPTTTSKSNQLSHWKAFCPSVLSALRLHKKEWALDVQRLSDTDFSPFCFSSSYYYSPWDSFALKPAFDYVWCSLLSHCVPARQ